MMDPFIFLTPILLLAVIALLGFVGCSLLGLDTPQPPGPVITAIAGDGEVFLSWEPFSDGVFNGGYNVKRGTALGGPYSRIGTVPSGTGSFTDRPLTNGNTFRYVVTQDTSEGESKNSNEVSVTPLPIHTVTFDNPAPPGNPGDPLTVPYKNLDFGNAAWSWVDPALGMGPANAIVINTGPSPGAGDISFTNGPRILQKIRVFPKRATIVTISTNGNPQRTVTYQAAQINMIQFIDLTVNDAADVNGAAWTNPIQTLTIGTDIGFDLLVDMIIYQGDL